MPPSRMARLGLATLVFLAPPAVALAQAAPGPQGAGIGSLEAGYGGAGRGAAQPFQPSTRDANGNRLVVNGRIIDGRGQASTTYTSGTGATGGGAGTSSATAIGNLINVQVSGQNNTVVLNARQTNSGEVTARVRPQ